MNRPPVDFTPIMAEPLKNFVTDVFIRVGIPGQTAEFIAALLVLNDLRGVVSHGTQQTKNYVSHFREGRLNPRAEVTTVRETASTLVLDGGGGLGYIPCTDAVHALIKKAEACGVAVATTGNHGHFGAAGLYANIPPRHGMIAYVTSGHQLDLHPGQFVMAAAGGSPMAFGIPCGEEPNFVLDFGAVHDMYLGPDEMGKIVEMLPSTVLRSFGLGCACQALGGLLCGVPVDPERADREWPGADQGSLMIVIDVKALFPLEQFTREMDEYARKVRTMMPLPGIEAAVLPGAIEAERYHTYSNEGIPIGARQAADLRRLAVELELTAPV